VDEVRDLDCGEYDRQALGRRRRDAASRDDCVVTVVIDTRTVEPSERFDFWIEGAHAVFFPLRFRRAPDDLRPFGGLVRQYLLGPLALTQVVTQPTTISRTRAEISSFDPRSIQLCYLRRGSMVGSQGGRDTTLSPGDIFIHDISAPSVLRSRQDTELLVLEAPKALLGREAVWAAENAGRNRVARVLARAPRPGHREPDREHTGSVGGDYSLAPSATCRTAGKWRRM
jgi:hypothetical protein